MELNKVNISQINYESITNLQFHNIARAIIDGHISDITLEGTVNVNKVRKDEVEAIASEINGIENLKFDDELYPGLTNFKVFPYEYYITFEDENVELLLINNSQTLNCNFDGIGFDKQSLLNITSIPDTIFKGNTDIKKFNELKYTSVVKLLHTFENSTIEEVTLPDTCTTIEYGFQYSNLKKINLNNVTKLYGQLYGFGHLSELEKVYVPKYRTMFVSYGCIAQSNPKMKYVMVPSVEDYVKSKISNNVSWDSAFVANSKCIYVGTLDDFNNDRFDDDHLVTQIDLDSTDYDDLDTISSAAFAGNEKLTYVNLRNKIKTLGPRAFAYCTNLTKIDGLLNVTTLEKYSFDGCPATLTSLNIQKLNNIAVAAFCGSSIVNIVAHKGLFNLNNYATSSSLDYSEYAFQSCKNLKTAKINVNNTTYIHRCFYACSSLESVEFEDSEYAKIEIMYRLFSDCSKLTTIINGNSIINRYTSNMRAMFYNCSSLEELDLSMCDFSNITECADFLYNCKKLRILKLPAIPSTFPNNWCNGTNNNHFDNLTEVSFNGKVQTSLTFKHSNSTMSCTLSDESLYNILYALDDNHPNTVTINSANVLKMQVLYPDLYNQKVAAGWTFK